MIGVQFKGLVACRYSSLIVLSLDVAGSDIQIEGKFDLFEFGSLEVIFALVIEFLNFIVVNTLILPLRVVTNVISEYA